MKRCSKLLFEAVGREDEELFGDGTASRAACFEI